MRLAPFAAAALVALSGSSFAATRTYTFNLDPMQEVPPVASFAAGSMTITIDDVLGSISYSLAAFSLEGIYDKSHIHFAPAGSNGPVVYNLGANADAIGPLTIGTFVIPNSLGITASGKGIDLTTAANINSKPWEYYVNVHTTKFPDGEIRGQLAPIPEPATVALMLGGLAMVGAAARRRRSS